MRYNVEEWTEIAVGENYTGKDRLVLQLSRPGAVFILKGDHAACAGYGTEFDLRIAGAFKFQVDPPYPSTQAYVKGDIVKAVSARPETFTSLDSVPRGNAQLDEVRRAIRQERLALSRDLQEMRTMIRAKRAEEAGEQLLEVEDGEPEPRPAAKKTEKPKSGAADGGDGSVDAPTKGAKPAAPTEGADD